MKILSEAKLREIEIEFLEDMENWWQGATDTERLNLTNSPKDLTTRQLEAQATAEEIFKGLEKRFKESNYIFAPEDEYNAFWNKYKE